MHIKILSNSEDISVWIIEPAKVMQYKCFSHSLLDFSHLFFILGKPNLKEEKPFEDVQLQDRKSKMEMPRHALVKGNSGAMTYVAQFGNTEELTLQSEMFSPMSYAVF